MSNKNNKMVSSKLMRLNSKKFELEQKESPFVSKTLESGLGRDSSGGGKYISKPVFGKMPGVKSELNGGFYYRNKPVKSPGSSSSSASQSLIKQSNLTGSKKFKLNYSGSRIANKAPVTNAQFEISNKSNNTNNTNFGLYDNSERRSSKAGISMLKFTPKATNAYSTDDRAQVSNGTMPNSIINNSSITGLEGGGLGGGGLAKLGRHNI